MLHLLFLVQFAASFVVHEWGTYTSCQGSNGLVLPGLHHGEVRDLPEFVHSRAKGSSTELWAEARKESATKRGIVPPGFKPETAETDCGFCSVMDWIPVAGKETEVTQKLETPVIYFYSDKRIEDVKVTVDFPQGLITEMYPQTSVNLPPFGKVQSTAHGHAEWNVTVQAPGVALRVPSVESTNIWAPSRRVNSNYVVGQSSAGAENERHIFYRGLARFDGPVKVTSTNEELIIENLSDEEIPAVWVLTSDGTTRGIVRCLCDIAPRSKISTPLKNGRFDLNDNEAMEMELYLLEAGIKLEMALIKSGLFPLEARAMVDTWTSNYFKSYGTRVLYIAPASYPDAILPWKIQPAPIQDKRVYVGRVEVILKTEEDEFKPIANRVVRDQYTPSQTLLKQEDMKAVVQLGRFAEAKIRRVLGSDFNQQQLQDFIFRELTYDRE